MEAIIKNAEIWRQKTVCLFIPRFAIFKKWIKYFSDDIFSTVA